jgi:integrase
VISQVVRPMVLTAGTTGLRQSELIGLRWRDVDWQAQRVRPRNAYVRGEHSSDGKSVLSMSRSVPMTDRVAGELHRHWTSSLYRADGDLVFAHPHLGTPLDRTKVTRIFKQGCRDARVPVIRFHDLRHTFGTRCAAAGIPLRTIQEWMGHADLKTTQIYAHYAPSAHETAMVNDAFAPALPPSAAVAQPRQPQRGGA